MVVVTDINVFLGATMVVAAIVGALVLGYALGTWNERRKHD